ncbi:type II toxin-antitoxin system VapC family toxin [Aquisphaera insulae]|uniref:type II toxin-antitoxin system VapC family toxin n=1 Tax=Aquisphaera insulae TaxID=2712864 RepID=UPI00202EA742|nr:type II toxin-antitoxin system VapC family toxin [Aquisphaera insulae]
MDATHVFVLDGSVTLVWGFSDEDDDYAAEILDKMPDLQAYVPGLWPLEVANALLVGERRGRTTAANTAHFLTLLGTFPIVVDDQTVARAWVETTHLARTHNLSAYDASYLELAIRLGLPLATLDSKLRDAAMAVGVSLFVVQ